jgi:hypothetical protein
MHTPGTFFGQTLVFQISTESANRRRTIVVFGAGMVGRHMHVQFLLDPHYVPVALVADIEHALMVMGLAGEDIDVPAIGRQLRAVKQQYRDPSGILHRPR